MSVVNLGILLDALSDWVHISVEQLGNILQGYSSLTRQKFSYGLELSLICHIILAATKVRSLQTEKKFSWFHSLVLVVFTGFSGGCVAPMMIGQLPAIVTNDLVIPVCVIIWYLTHSRVLDFTDFLNLRPVQIIWTIGAMVFRGNAACNIVSSASTILKAGSYYPIPLIGPIVAGTTVGSVGMFFPLDKGLSPIQAGVPFNIQSAFLSAAFYHLMVHDKQGAIGTLLRLTVGSYSEETTRAIVVTFLIVTAIIQIYFGPNANPLSPFHQVFYLVFQVPGPTTPANDPSKKGPVGWDYGRRRLLNQVTGVGRFFIVVAAVFLHIYTSTAPRTVLAISKAVDVSKLRRAETESTVPVVGGCQLLSSLRSCTSRVLVAKSSGNPSSLVTLEVQSSRKSSNVSEENVPSAWSLSTGVNVSSLPDPSSKLMVRLGGDGALRLVLSADDLQTEQLVWTSKSTCIGFQRESSATSSYNDEWPVLRIDNKSGEPTILCPGGGSVVLA